MSIIRNTPLLWLFKAQQQTYQGAFSTAGFTYNGNIFTSSNRKTNVMNNVIALYFRSSSITIWHYQGIGKGQISHLKGPGELPTSQDLKRWMPTALQRIEGLQEQLRAGNLDEFQTKKRVAEIIAARKLVEARRAGKFQHADQRLNRKLTDPQKLNDKAGDLVTCLTLLTSDQNESLARQAKEGHGGAMLESFKTMNSVKLHMQGINGGMAINPKYKLDAALAMAIYRESAQNAELQLDDTGAVHTAAVLRKLPFYKEFENRPETRDKLTQEVNIGSLYSDFVQMKDEHLERENQRENVNELLEPEGPARGNTEQNILNWQ